MTRRTGETAVYYAARNDGDGNPQRGWLVTTPNGVVFVDEGHQGDNALRSRYPDAEVDPATHRIATEYYELLRRTYEGKPAR